MYSSPFLREGAAVHRLTLDLNTASVQNNYFDLYCVFLGLPDLFWGRGGGGINFS